MTLGFPLFVSIIFVSVSKYIFGYILHKFSFSWETNYSDTQFQYDIAHNIDMSLWQENEVYFHIQDYHISIYVKIIDKRHDISNTLAF